MSNNFDNFYTKWIDEHRQLINQLRHTLKPPNTTTTTTTSDTILLNHLVQKSMSHFNKYYEFKSLAAKRHVLSFFAAPWTTALESSLQWIGGWRPTTAFHLVYTESSILFESQVVDILRGIRTGDLGDLSPEQFRRVSDLQCETVHQENDITDQLSDWQDGAIDLIGMYGNDVEAKMGMLVGILERADELRVKTIERLVELLTPLQAAEYLVAAAELHFGIRCWGFKQDRQRANGINTTIMNGVS